MTKVEDYLNAIRESKGDDAWKSEVVRLAKEAIKTSPKHEQYWKNLTAGYDWLDWEALKKDGDSMQETIASLIQQQMPALKSQAQYDAVSGTLQAVQHLINSILESSKLREQEAAKALDLSLEALRTATELTLKLEEVPEAVSSSAGDAFKNPPAQFSEVELVGELLSQLLDHATVEDLNQWYANTKEQRDKVVTQSLRNELLDAIRRRRNQL